PRTSAGAPRFGGIRIHPAQSATRRSDRGTLRQIRRRYERAVRIAGLRHNRENEQRVSRVGDQLLTERAAHRRSRLARRRGDRRDREAVRRTHHAPADGRTVHNERGELAMAITRREFLGSAAAAFVPPLVAIPSLL